MIDETKYPKIAEHLGYIQDNASIGHTASIALLSEFIAFIKEAEMTEGIAAERLRAIEEMQEEGGDIYGPDGPITMPRIALAPKDIMPEAK